MYDISMKKNRQNQNRAYINENKKKTDRIKNLYISNPEIFIHVILYIRGI